MQFLTRSVFCKYTHFAVIEKDLLPMFLLRFYPALLWHACKIWALIKPFNFFFQIEFLTMDSKKLSSNRNWINPLNPELNPICYLLTLLGAHHFLHVSRIRVKSLTLRRLKSYVYMEHQFLMFLDHTQRRSTVGRTPLDE